MANPPISLFEIDFQEEVQIRKHTEKGSYSSWVIENRSGKISIETIHNKIDSAEFPSISMYDNVLSTSISERDNYSMDTIELNGVKFRLVERSFSSGLNFIELYGQNVCQNNSQLLITGVDMTQQDVDWLKECFQSIVLKCEGT